MVGWTVTADHDGALPQRVLEQTWPLNSQRTTFVDDLDRHVANADSNGRTRLTDAASTGGKNLNPAWSPDGRSIVFVSARDGNRELYLMNLDVSK